MIVPMGLAGALYFVFAGFFLAIGWAFGSWVVGIVLAAIQRGLAK